MKNTSIPRSERALEDHEEREKQMRKKNRKKKTAVAQPFQIRLRPSNKNLTTRKSKRDASGLHQLLRHIYQARRRRSRCCCVQACKFMNDISLRQPMSSTSPTPSIYVHIRPGMPETCACIVHNASLGP